MPAGNSIIFNKLAAAPNAAPFTGESMLWANSDGTLQVSKTLGSSSTVIDIESPSTDDVIYYNGSNWASGPIGEVVGEYNRSAFQVVFDGGGSAIAANSQLDVLVPTDCTLISGYLLATPTGSIVVDIYKNDFSAFPPTSDNSITSGTPLTISSGIKEEDVDLTGWNKEFYANQVLRFNVDSATDISRCTVVLVVDVGPLDPPV